LPQPDNDGSAFI